uniref:EGF-like domain-containing protein n=1 Tax=Parastrongyloides trichosuri TaxID=131310 RepID=A0A0N4ZMD9_PARTI
MFLKSMCYIFAIILVLSINGGAGNRVKRTDENNENVTEFDLNNIEECGVDDVEFGMINGTFEECFYWKNDNGKWTAAFNDLTSQIFRCNRTKINGMINDKGECVCKPLWFGPLCNFHVSCGEGKFFRDGKCVDTICANNGKLALVDNSVECICNGPWGGRFCEMLQCFRLSPDRLHEKRFVNTPNGTCVCSHFFKGEKCDQIVKCTNNGIYMNGYCKCNPGYHGEICDIPCKKSNETCIENKPIKKIMEPSVVDSTKTLETTTICNHHVHGIELMKADTKEPSSVSQLGFSLILLLSLIFYHFC